MLNENGDTLFTNLIFNMKKTIIFTVLASLLLTSCAQVITKVEPENHPFVVTMAGVDGSEIKYSMDVPVECGTQSTTGLTNIDVTELCGPNLLLLTFSEAPSDPGSDKILNAEETYTKFKEELLGDSLRIDITNPEIPVETFSYADGSKSYLYPLIFPLKNPNGTVAMWTYKGSNYVLVDVESKHQNDGLFMKIYTSFKEVQ